MDAIKNDNVKFMDVIPGEPTSAKNQSSRFPCGGENSSRMSRPKRKITSPMVKQISSMNSSNDLSDSIHEKGIINKSAFFNID